MIPLPDLLQCSPTGLTREEVPRSRARDGGNLLTPPRRISLWRQYLAQFADPIIRILLVAVVLSAIVAFIEGHSLVDTVGITLAVILATTIAFLTEYKSNREFDALNELREDAGIKVIRDASRPGSGCGISLSGIMSSLRLGTWFQQTDTC